MTKVAKILYPDIDVNYFELWDYQPIIDYLGEVLIQRESGEYEGDIHVLLLEDGWYGFVSIGYGSCSGCDALKACDSYEDLETLILGIVNSVKWFKSSQEVLDCILSEERKFSYYFHEESYQEFCEEAKTKLLQIKAER